MFDILSVILVLEVPAACPHRSYASFSRRKLPCQSSRSANFKAAPALVDLLEFMIPFQQSWHLYDQMQVSSGLSNGFSGAVSLLPESCTDSWVKFCPCTKAGYVVGG